MRKRIFPLMVVVMIMISMMVTTGPVKIYAQICLQAPAE